MIADLANKLPNRALLALSALCLLAAAWVGTA